LSQTYREHQAAGKFVFLSNEDVDETYPSLVEAVRATRRRQNTGDGDGVSPTPGPTPVPSPQPEEALS
jgi:hypothetical protein